MASLKGRNSKKIIPLISLTDSKEFNLGYDKSTTVKIENIQSTIPSPLVIKMKKTKMAKDTKRKNPISEKGKSKLKRTRSQQQHGVSHPGNTDKKQKEPNLSDQKEENEANPFKSMLEFLVDRLAITSASSEAGERRGERINDSNDTNTDNQANMKKPAGINTPVEATTTGKGREREYQS